MKHAVLIFSLFLAGFLPAQTIINAFPSPTASPGDLAFDGTYLWVEGYLDSVLYKISPQTGAVIGTIPTNITRPYGLEFANGFLWVVDTDNKLIQQVDPANGNVIAMFPTPCTSASSYPGGLAWDGQSFWNNDLMSTNPNPFDSLYQITASGQLIQQHLAYGTTATGLAWDGQYLWSSDNLSQEIYKINTNTFAVLDTIPAPGGMFPNGLASDGASLWVANNDHDSIYQIALSKASSVPAVAQSGPQFDLYPNPATDNFQIQTGDESIGSEYVIIDQHGRVVLTGKLENTTTVVNTEELSAGVYSCRIGLASRLFVVTK
jgi:DNA-binding beta-propeller fold protein YncE